MAEQAGPRGSQRPDSSCTRVESQFDHKFHSTAYEIPRTCASLSILTARTASRFSSRYCPVFSSSLALRLSSMMFRVSLVRKPLGVPGVSRRLPSDTFRTLILKSVESFGRSSEPLFRRDFPQVPVCTPEQRYRPRDGGHPAEFGWMAPPYKTWAVFSG